MLDDDDNNNRNNKFFEIKLFNNFIFIFFLLLEVNDLLQKINFLYHLVEYWKFSDLDSPNIEPIILK
jgi:hypothetical protein